MAKNKNNNNWQLFIRLLKIANFQRTAIILAVGLTIVQSLLTALQPNLYQYIIDHVIMARHFDQLELWAIILLIWLIAQTIMAFFNSYLSEKIAQSIILKLRQYIYDHLTHLKLSFFDKTPVGTAVTRSITDVQTITDLFSSGIITILGDTVQILAILICMFLINWKLTLLTLTVIPMLIWAGNFFRKGTRDTFQEVRNQVAALNAFLQERITGMGVIQLFNQQKAEFIKFKSINQKHRDANFKSIFYYSVFFPIVEVLVALSFAIIVSYGSIQIFQKNLQLGEVTAFIMFINLFFRPVRAIADRFNNIQMGIVAAERIFNLLDATENQENYGNIKPIKLEGKIEFKNVRFRYNRDENQWILNGLSFLLEPGKSLAIIGATGSGKTSIANLITYNYQHEVGQIFIDDQEVQNYHLPSLRQRIAFVLQDVFLFSGSIESNLSLKQGQDQKQKFQSIAEEIGAWDFIKNLPGDLDFNVMERGLSLSQGQRQLISFIRALAVDPDIIILDEATSSIDSQSESLIQKAIELLMKNRTAVVIAHRLSTIKNCDQIMVIEGGSIAEKGTHSELLEKGGHYKQLYETQISH